MFQNPTGTVTPQLPENFVNRLKEIIPETTDQELYQLLTIGPYSRETYERLNAYFMILQQNVNSLHRFTQLRDLLAEWMPNYTAIHPKKA